MNPWLRLGLIFALLGSCSAQECSSIVFPLNVFTKNGLAVQGVVPDRLLVQVHDEPAKINRFSLDTSPRRVVLLLDTSGSMAGIKHNEWEFAVNLALFAINTIPSDASISVGSIGEKSQFGDFGDHAQAEARVRALTEKSFGGHTPLFDSIHQALGKLSTPHFGDVVYLVTDGGNNASKLDEQAILSELARHDTRVFALLLTRIVTYTREERIGPSLIGELVHKTGGHLTIVPAPPISRTRQTLLFKTAPLVRWQIGNSYRMVVALAEPIKEPASVKIRYTGPDKELGKSFRWVYPSLIGCHPAP